MTALDFCRDRDLLKTGIGVEHMEEYARIKTAALEDKLARKEIQFQKAVEQDYCSICGKILDGYKGE